MGVLLALYQDRQKRRLSTLVRAGNWYSYHRAGNALETATRALARYKEAHSDRIDPEVIEYLARSVGIGEEVVTDVVHAIQTIEPSFSPADIDRWLAEGKIGEQDAKRFHRHSRD